MGRLRSFGIVFLATGAAAAADTTLVSGTAEPSSSPPPPPHGHVSGRGDRQTDFAFEGEPE